MSIRVVLNVSAASPELRNELEAIPLRHRAERIRSLATLGLMVARDQIRVISGSASGYISGEEEATDGSDGNKQDQDDSTNSLVASFVQDLGGF